MPAPAAKQQEVAERRIAVVRMRARGIPPHVIARELGVSLDVVYQDVSVTLRARREELARDCDLLVAAQVEELDQVRMVAWRNATMKHYISTQSGQVARDPDSGEPLLDTAPVDRALGVVIKVQERIARLLGLDAALKVRAQVDHRVVPIEDMRSTVEQLRQQVETERQTVSTIRYSSLPES